MVGYLVCDKCDNYYKLQPDELPEDLMINVTVGGYLKFKTHMKGVNEDVPIQTQQTYGSRLSYRDRRDIFVIIAFLVVKWWLNVYLSFWPCII
jgi:hypothetical protein